MTQEEKQGQATNLMLIEQDVYTASAEPNKLLDATRPYLEYRQVTAQKYLHGGCSDMVRKQLLQLLVHVNKEIIEILGLNLDSDVVENL